MVKLKFVIGCKLCEQQNHNSSIAGLHVTSRGQVVIRSAIWKEASLVLICAAQGSLIFVGIFFQNCNLPRRKMPRYAKQRRKRFFSLSRMKIIIQQNCTWSIITSDTFWLVEQLWHNNCDILWNFIMESNRSRIWERRKIQKDLLWSMMLLTSNKTIETLNRI